METITGGDGVSVVPRLKDAVLSVLKNAPALKK
jgi:hypothetical protein